MAVISTASVTMSISADGREIRGTATPLSVVSVLDASGNVLGKTTSGPSGRYHLYFPSSVAATAKNVSAQPMGSADSYGPPVGSVPAVTYSYSYLSENQAVGVPNYPNDRIRFGSYTAIIAIKAENKTAMVHSQSIAYDPAFGPVGSIITWSFPTTGDTTGVKSWTYWGYGNYLDNTFVQTPIAASKINSLTTLKIRTGSTYTGPQGSANVTPDFFLFGDTSGSTAQIVAEIQRYDHLPQSTKDNFLENYGVVTNLGIYTSPAIDGTPSIKWKASYQAPSGVEHGLTSTSTQQTHRLGEQ